MKVSELIAKRQPLWRELEMLGKKVGGKPEPEIAERFSSLYRAACADLALAEAYQLPPNTVDYLQRLVAKSHNQLYRSHKFQWRGWFDKIFFDTPRMIFNDPCIHIAAVVFWGLFILAAVLAYENSVWPGFAESVVGEEQLESFKEMYSSFGGRSGVGGNVDATGFYMNHNAGIGLKCFVLMLFVIPGMVILSENAIQLGSVFGYMFRPEHGDASMNFQQFVTAHGPFELTAIILSAGAGLKIGLGWLMTNGLTRTDSILKAGREALPIAMCAVVLFAFAALIEGFISPTTTQFMPWVVKGIVAVGSSCALMIYFVVLGYPHDGSEELT